MPKPLTVAQVLDILERRCATYTTVDITAEYEYSFMVIERCRDYVRAIQNGALSAANALMSIDRIYHYS